MTTATDVRPLLMAAVLTLLVMAGSLASGPLANIPASDLSFGGDADPAVAVAALPLYAAYLSACDVGSTRPECPSGLPPVAPVVGRISMAFGTADGWLAAGSLDRFDLSDAGLQITAHLEGDLGPAIGVYAAGVTLVDPAEGHSSVRGLPVPDGVGLVQIVVHNPTQAPREYRLVLN